MKKVIIVLALCLLGVSLFAQEKERVAILPFTGGDAGEGDAIAQILGTELTKLGDFQIVQRTAAINKVMEEHDFQRGGLTDGDTIVALGKGVNAKYVVSGNIQNLGERKMISASILDVETFQQVAGDYYEYDQLEEVISYLPTLAERLVDRTKNDYSALPTLAILPFAGVDENSADVLAQLLAIELANTGKYAVISRTSTIEKAMEEQNIQRSGLTDASTASKLGEAINAQFVLSGNVLGIGAADLMNVTIIEVLTLVQKGGAYTQYETIEEGVELMSELSYDLTGISESRLSLDNAIALYEDDTTERNGNRVIDLIKELVTKGINASNSDDSNYNPLLYASQYGYTEIVKALIAEGAYLEAQANNGNTSLYFASMNGHIEAVKELIVAGANVNVKGYNGHTPLTATAINGYTEVVKVLIEAGANPDAQRDDGSTALHMAASNGYIEVIIALIEGGANSDVQDGDGDTALHMAASNGYIEVIIALIEGGANPDAESDGWYGTALIRAAYRGDTEVIKALIEGGANVNIKDEFGDTALDNASDGGHTEIATLLKRAGASEYNIGDRGSGGGLVFYISGNIHLECSPNLGEADWYDAHTLAEDYRGGGYNDWYLPNKDELNYIYENLRVKGFILDDGWLWSSSEDSSDDEAWQQDFSDGVPLDYDKSDIINVRAIRAFNP